MLDKCKILYEGDVFTAIFYVVIGFILLALAGFLTYLGTTHGYKFLSIGLYMFSAYCIGKGLFMWYSYRARFLHYNAMTEMDQRHNDEEIAYTSYRIQKKNTNRRRYSYLLVISSVLAFMGIFTRQKGFIMGTFIPIALIAGIELGIGLLTEFRLREFLRLLLKYKSENF